MLASMVILKRCPVPRSREAAQSVIARLLSVTGDRRPYGDWARASTTDPSALRNTGPVCVISTENPSCTER